MKTSALSPAATGAAPREAHLEGRLRQQAVVENLLEAVMADRPGCDTWELGARTRLAGDQWVVPVRLTVIKENGWLSPKKTKVEIRFAVVDGEGRHLATHREHPVRGATPTFPKNDLNSWDPRGP